MVPEKLMQSKECMKNQDRRQLGIKLTSAIKRRSPDVVPLLKTLSECNKEDLVSILKFHRYEGRNILMLVESKAIWHLGTLLKIISTLDNGDKAEILKYSHPERGSFYCPSDHMKTFSEIISTLEKNDQVALLDTSYLLYGSTFSPDLANIITQLDQKSQASLFIRAIKDNPRHDMRTEERQERILTWMEQAKLSQECRVSIFTKSLPYLTRNQFKTCTILKSVHDAQGLLLNFANFKYLVNSLCNYINQRKVDHQMEKGNMLDSLFAGQFIRRLTQTPVKKAFSGPVKIKAAEKLLANLLFPELHKTNQDYKFNDEELQALSDGKLKKAFLIKHKIPYAISQWIHPKRNLSQDTDKQYESSEGVPVQSLPPEDVKDNSDAVVDYSQVPPVLSEQSRDDGDDNLQSPPSFNPAWMIDNPKFMEGYNAALETMKSHYDAGDYPQVYPVLNEQSRADGDDNLQRRPPFNPAWMIDNPEFMEGYSAALEAMKSHTEYLINSISDYKACGGDVLFDLSETAPNDNEILPLTSTFTHPDLKGINFFDGRNSTLLEPQGDLSSVTCDSAEYSLTSNQSPEGTATNEKEELYPDLSSSACNSRKEEGIKTRSDEDKFMELMKSAPNAPTHSLNGGKNQPSRKPNKVAANLLISFSALPSVPAHTPKKEETQPSNPIKLALGC